MFMVDVVVFFFKQKTAYEMRISDWSSDVCSSDLLMVSFGNATGPVPPVDTGLLAAKGSLYLTRPSIMAYMARSEEHTSELQSLMRISYAVFCLKKKNKKQT